MQRTNNFSCRLQLLVKPGGPLESTVNEDFRETVCLSSSTGKVSWVPFRGKENARTTWWAMTALLQNAVQTSTDDHSPVATLLSRTSALLTSVISSSRADSRPHLAGMSVTSDTSSEGDTINHSFGMDAV